MIFDTHCHYNLEPLFANWQEHWNKAQAHDVTKSLVVGTDLESCGRGLEIAASSPSLRTSVAIHPSEYQYLIEQQQPTPEAVNTLIESQINQLRVMAQNPLVVAIGETGLDYFRLPSDSQLATQIKQAQQAGFKAHLALARELKLPVIIHVRDQGEAAYLDVLAILKETHPLPQPFILHCISGPESYVQAALELGGYLGIAGNITYKSAEQIRNLIHLAPPDRLLLETDAPFLPPQEFRGKTCEPWMISQTAEFVQDELNFDLDQLYQNATDLFGF